MQVDCGDGWVEQGGSLSGWWVDGWFAAAKQIANLTDFGAAAGSLTIFRHARSNMPHTQLGPPKHDPSFVYGPPIDHFPSLDTHCDALRTSEDKRISLETFMI